MYLITPLTFALLLALTSATFDSKDRKPSRLSFYEETKKLTQPLKTEELKPEKPPKTEEDKKQLKLPKKYLCMGHGSMSSTGCRQPVAEEEFSFKRKYAPKPKSWGKFQPAPKVVVIPKPYWKPKPMPEKPAVPKEEPIETMPPIPVEVTETPVEVTEAPSEVTQVPVEVTEVPGEVTEAPIEATEAPIEVTEAPALAPTEAPVVEITERPHPILPTPSTMKYVLNHEAAEKYWATANFPTATPAAPAAPQVVITEAPQLTETESAMEQPESNVGYVLNEEAAENYWATASLPEVTPAAPQVSATEIPLLSEEVKPVEPAKEQSETIVKYDEPLPTEAPQVQPVTVPETMIEKSVEELASAEQNPQKYVLDEGAAEKYWATASFETTAAPALEAMTGALEPEKEIPKEQAETNPPAETIPDVKSVEERPVEVIPTATKEYVLNEEAAADYWATAKFETTAAPSVPMAEASKPVEEVPEEEVAQTNPHVEPAPEEKPIEEKPVKVAPPATTKYVLNEEAAADYWATAKYEATTVPSETKTEASAPQEISKDEPMTLPSSETVSEEKPVEELSTAKPEKPEKKPEKPIKKPLMPSILGAKGIVIEKKEQKKYWIHKPFGHPKNIGNWHLTKPLKPCLQKKPTEKLVNCQP